MAIKLKAPGQRSDHQFRRDEQGVAGPVRLGLELPGLFFRAQLYDSPMAGYRFNCQWRCSASFMRSILTQWVMSLHKPGELDSYTLKTQHAAIRGFNFFQRVEPYYANFMRLIRELERDPDFRTYPLATHLTHSWLGGNLRVSNQASASEQEIGADLMRNYYLQQLDWLMGVTNLWHHHSFRSGGELESSLTQDGLAFHQMRRMLRHDSNYFTRATRRPSPWPGLHPGWIELDRIGRTNRLQRI